MSIPQINDDVLKKENAIWPRLGIVGLEPSSPIWANLNKNLYAIKRISNVTILEGKVQVKEIYRTSTNHKYKITVKSNHAKLRENTLYFPGWILKVNNLIKPINFMDNKNAGIITFNLNKGIHYVNLIYEKTLIRKISDILSIATFIFLILFYYKKKFFTYLKKLNHFPRLK